MKQLYKNETQRNLVVAAVAALLKVGDSRYILSKDTLNLICDRYCYLVDPPQTVTTPEEDYKSET